MKTTSIQPSRPLAALLLGVALMLGGCASTDGLAPQLKPTAATEVSSSRTLATAKSTQPQGVWPASDWWKALGDPQLDALIAEALQNSPDLAVVDARLRQVSAVALNFDSKRSPKLSAFGTVQGVYVPDTIAPEPFGDSFVTPKIVGLNGSYHMDIWGGARADWEAAINQQRAAEVDSKAARLLLSVDVARAYARLGYAFLAYDLADEDNKRAVQLQQLTTQRVAAGIDMLERQRSAESLSAITQQHLLKAANEIEQDRIALALLIGKGPDRGIDIARPAVLQPVALALPDNLPADLLGRRPDIVAARWRVEAAGRNIDASKAAFYPSFNLTAALGLISLHTSDLFSLRSRYYMLAPAISLPIFDGGHLRATLAGRDADYDVAVAQYNKTLVTAFNQVATQIKATQSLKEQEAALQRSVDTAREACDLAMQRYRRGISGYVEVLDIQRALLAAESSLADLHLLQIDASVQLVQTLGGGYQMTTDTTAQQATTRTPS